jgi:hypothetical protein
MKDVFVFGVLAAVLVIVGVAIFSVMFGST